VEVGQLHAPHATGHQARTNPPERPDTAEYGHDVAESSYFHSTIAAYDATADLYAELIGTEISSAIEGPVDRALLEAFAELVVRSNGLIADIGCETGRVAAFLATRGVNVVGVEPSPGMLALAAAAHPHHRFEFGAIDTTTIRDADGAHESTPQAFLLALHRGPTA